MNVFFKIQIHFLSLSIFVNSFSLADENSIENLLYNMNEAVALKNIITHFHNIYQNYHPFIKSKSYSFETYDYNIKGLNDLENFLDKL